MMPPLFQLKATKCECVMTWVTRPVRRDGAQVIGVAAYDIAQVIDWTKCKEHNPEFVPEPEKV
jgi:hypothetical protein